MKKQKLAGLLSAMMLFGACPWLGMSTCHAEIVEGYAVIVNGDVAKAQFEARQDAMRQFVEKKVGVQVSSTTQTDMGMVISDRIVTNSNGYVQVKRELDGKQSGDLYIIRLDLEASPTLIQTAIKDLRGQLEALEENTSRSLISVAVSGRDAYGVPMNMKEVNDYVRGKMEDQGFRVATQEAVSRYMDTHKDLSSLSVGAEIRKLAIENRGGESALLRGIIQQVSEKRVDKKYQATVNVSFELIGLDNNISNSYAEYFSGIGDTSEDAWRNARRNAVRTAVESLGQKALKTVQRETRGGVQHLKFTLSFQNLPAQAESKQQILQTLKELRCRIIRYSYDAGTFKAFIDATGYQGFGDFQDALEQKINNLTSVKQQGQNMTCSF